ncbi:MAG: hypothetical protein QHH07_02480 [Sedimentisphaerales bacterium]|jgi:aminoglycoside phosphotransferase|nr:hypothetical protein [Sedimentisphaerales bacterium]
MGRTTFGLRLDQIRRLLGLAAETQTEAEQMPDDDACRQSILAALLDQRPPVDVLEVFHGQQCQPCSIRKILLGKDVDLIVLDKLRIAYKELAAIATDKPQHDVAIDILCRYSHRAGRRWQEAFVAIL